MFICVAPAFNLLSNETYQTIRQRYVTGGASVLTALSRTGSCVNRLAKITYEICLRGAGSLKSVGGDHFQVPRHDLAVGIRYVHIKIGVRILPSNIRKCALQVQAFASV